MATNHTTRGPDRRTAQRRHEDAALHYAEAALLAAALNAADLRKRGSIAEGLAALRALDDAAEAYRCAEAWAAAAARRSPAGTEEAWYEQHDGWVK